MANEGAAAIEARAHEVIAAMRAAGIPADSCTWVALVQVAGVMAASDGMSPEAIARALLSVALPGARVVALPMPAASGIVH